MSDRVRLSLDLLYVAIENLIINVGDGDGHDIEIVLTLAEDMKGAITDYWQGADHDVFDEFDLGA